MKTNSNAYDRLLRLLQFEQRFPTLLILPQVNQLILNNDPTLAEIVKLCESNKTLFAKLTNSRHGNEDLRQFAKDILLKKGMSYLQSICIRAMNQEIFVLPLCLIDGITETVLKRRSIILARYVKLLHSELSVLPDDAYLCGLFYNFRLVCFELLAESEDLGSHDFELEEDEISCALGASFRNLGFNNKICTFIENSAKEIYSTEHPSFHAISRIGNQMITNSDQTGSTTFRNTSFIDPKLLEVTGLSLREIVEPMKEVVKDFKGGTNRQ